MAQLGRTQGVVETRRKRQDEKACQRFPEDSGNARTTPMEVGGKRNSTRALYCSEQGTYQSKSCGNIIT